MNAIHSGRLHAEGNLDIEGFIDLLDRLLKAAWGNDWGTFTDQFPTGTDPEQLPLPIITWDIKERVTSDMKGNSFKPRNWGTEPDPERPGDFVTVYRHWFDCDIEFTVWAKTTREAKILLEKLEDILVSYTGYFREKGIKDLYFISERRGVVESQGRQDLAYRTLTYRVTIEKIWIARNYTLRQVIAQVESAQVNPTTQPARLRVEL